ncbi:SGT1-domain-containing protein [Panus rudis PR-1116 ss-1]|nr:SGT1-domain-containing protein [Panus rudis PR-1116 ss-1]
MNVNDIFNRPHSISEDTLHYVLYPPTTLSDKASVTTLAMVMQSYTASLLPDLLWHRDAFQLKVVQNMSGEGYVLEGRMRVGDCVDDEWCAVWLLWQISSKWDVVISASDSDGEFLLIEAAEHLPDWVTPSNAENRVWIYQSHLHLVPLSQISPPSSRPAKRKYPGVRDEEGIDEANDDEWISVPDAIKVVRDPLIDTLASQEVENDVWKRIRGYPGAARQHVHHTKAYLPVDVAKALFKNPSLVQKAVEAFYTRDALQLRAAHRMSRFPPEPSVLTTVKMTRTSYAQLMGQRFYPPKVFGRWQENEGTPEWRRRDIGMKIACGFEMLYQESKNKATVQNISGEAAAASAEAKKEGLKRNPDYHRYIQNLKSMGYFRDEKEGSQLWNELEDKAANMFIEVRRDEDAARPLFAAEVNTAIAQSDANDYVSNAEEDPDDWLNVDFDSFDAMLEDKIGRSKRLSPENRSQMDIDLNAEAEEDRVARTQAERLQKMAKQVEEFIEGEGDLEGARFNDDVDMASGDDRPEQSNDSTEQERRARQEAMDKLVPGIDPSEYGKMPASFHNNSQRVKATTIETDVIEEVTTPGASAPDREPEVKKRGIRPPILPRDHFDGAESDNETDEEGEGDSEEEENQPQVVGEVEIDMEEEEEEFLEFARQALGLSDTQWNDIIAERKERGAFIPATVVSENKNPINKNAFKETLSSGQAQASSRPPRQPASGPRPNANPELDSFERVMEAMEAELAKSRRQNGPAPPKVDKGKGKAGAHDLEGVDIEAAMDAELKAAMEKENQGSDDEDEDGEGQLDYNLIKNFLESFKSQDGLSGPVSSLVGRLQPEWRMPRDES